MAESPRLPILDSFSKAMENRSSQQEGPIFLEMEDLYPFPVSAENPELAYLEGYDNLPEMVIFMSEDSTAYALLGGEDASEASPVVHLSDEGEADVLAGNLRDFFDLLLATIDGEFDEDFESFSEYHENAREECGELFDELRDAIGLGPVDLRDVHSRILAAQKKHADFSLGDPSG